MDGDRFDALTRTLESRRTTLRSMAGGLAVFLGIAGSNDAAARCVKIGKRCKKQGRKLACCGGAKCKGVKCKCTGGRQACGGVCRTACPAGHEREPGTCGCCGESGSTCEVAGECCSGLCEQIGLRDRLCVCIAVTGGCELDRECCSRKCDRGQCTCSPAGRPCGTTLDCCSGLICGDNFRCVAI